MKYLLTLLLLIAGCSEYTVYETRNAKVLQAVETKNGTEMTVEFDNGVIKELHTKYLIHSGKNIRLENRQRLFSRVYYWEVVWVEPTI